MKKNNIYLTTSESELIALGSDFGKQLDQATIVTLNGELGAGKTTFTKGIAKGLAIDTIITSPTFSIVKEYENKLVHIDAYRIFDEDLGIDDYLDQNMIICVEWSDNIADYLTYVNYQVDLEYTLEGRKITITKMQ